MKKIVFFVCYVVKFDYLCNVFQFKQQIKRLNRKGKKMKNNIINGLQFNELKETMQTMIEESIASLSYNGGYNDKKDYLSHLAWYKDCEMNDYFGGGFEEIWDENGEKVGEGLNTINYKFVLNDDTRTDFESAFEQARDEAFEARLKEIAEEIEEIDDDNIKDINIDNDGSEEEIGSRISEASDAIQKQGGISVANDSDNVLDFRFDLLQDIYETGCNLTCRQIAAWAGANVCIRYQGNDPFDYVYDFYRVDKKIETDLDNMTVHAYGYDENDNAEVEVDMQNQVDKDMEDDDCAYEVMGADFFEEESVWSAKLLEFEKCDETLFEIVMGMSKEDYKQQEELHDFEVEVAFNDAERNFNSRDFRDVSDCTAGIEDFEENAEFGQKAYIDGVTYYKVRNSVDEEPYTIYFEDEHLEIL